MEYVLTAREMAQADKNTSEVLGVPSIVLMERAALAVADRADEYLKSKSFSVKEKSFIGRYRADALVAAGPGNNGGDGLAVGRILMERGYNVEFALIGDESRFSELQRLQLASVCAYGGKVHRGVPDGFFALVIDAIFGISLSRSVEGIFAGVSSGFHDDNAIAGSLKINFSANVNSALNGYFVAVSEIANRLNQIISCRNFDAVI